MGTAGQAGQACQEARIPRTFWLVVYRGLLFGHIKFLAQRPRKSTYLSFTYLNIVHVFPSGYLRVVSGKMKGNPFCHACRPIARQNHQNSQTILIHGSNYG